MNELLYKLMNEVGLSVDDQYNLVDQDYGTVVFLNGKVIKAARNGLEPFVSRQEVYFNPIENVKLMRMLFQYYIKKLNVFDNKYFPLFYPISNDKGMGGFEIKNDKEIYRSNYYNNECLRYIDLIFRMSGENVDLSSFDQVR